MKKTVAVLTTSSCRDYFSRFFADVAPAYSVDVLLPETFSNVPPADALFLFLPIERTQGQKEFLVGNKLFARARTLETDRGIFTLVDNAFGGIYDEEKGFRKGDLGREAYDVERISEIEIERVARAAYEYCEKYDCPLTSLDLADRLYVSRLWRRAIHDVGSDYPDTRLIDEFATDYVAKLPSVQGKTVLVSTALFSDFVYASLLSHGAKNPRYAYRGESNFGVFGTDDPAAVKGALTEMMETLFEDYSSARCSDAFSFFNF